MTAEFLRAAAGNLARLHERFAPLFGRAEPRNHSRTYIHGLILHKGRKSVEPMALDLAHEPGQPKSQARVLAMQGFLTDSPWTQTEVQREIQAVFTERLVPSTRRWSVGTVGVIDESSYVKRGEHSVGVARQHCGRLGKLENCQVGVFLVGVTPDGSALLDHQLYLPKAWVDVVEPPKQKLTPEQRRDQERRIRQRRDKARVPETVTFATKPQLALRLIERGTVPLNWVTADDLYGRNQTFLEGLEKRKQPYVLEVPGFIRVWTEDPMRCQGPESADHRPSRAIERQFIRRVDDLAASLPPEAWTILKIREGTKGPLAFQFARVRVWAVRDRKAGPPIWVVIQRSLDAKPQTRYWVSNAPEEVGLEVMVEVLGCRWRVEETFEDAKFHLGMADYEARAWTSWHHHMSLVALAHLYVTLTRLELRESEPALTLDMAVKLIEASLERPRLPIDEAMALVQYRLQRNDTAHQSHRKTWLKNHPEVSG
jgi:SRSO17 transposase